MERILFGDNQFFAVNHISDEKSRAQSMKFKNDQAIIKTRIELGDKHEKERHVLAEDLKRAQCALNESSTLKGYPSSLRACPLR